MRPRFFRPPWWAPQQRTLQILKIREESPGHVGLSVRIGDRVEGIGIDTARLRNPARFIALLRDIYGDGVRVKPEPRDWNAYVDRMLDASR